MKKINFIDIMIILILAAGLVWFFGFRGESGGTVSNEDENFFITYMSPSYPDFVTDYFEIGASIEDFIKGGNIGTVKNIFLEQGYDVRAGTDGVLVRSPKEGYQQVTIVSSATGRKAENGVIINGNTYLVGQYVTMRAGEGKLFIMLTGIERY